MKHLGLVGLASWLGGLYPTKVEPGWLRVEKISLALPRLDDVFSGLKVAQISDIHMGKWMPPQRFTHVVDEVLAQEPDLVVITGDFFSGYTWKDDFEETFRDFAEELSRLSDAYLTLAVLGNHDYWTSVGAVRELLKQTNIIELSNDVFSLIRGKARLHFCGLDDAYNFKDDIEHVLSRTPKDGAAILLAHEPDTADENAATGRFDLQLSGHSHGGQVVLFGFEKFWYPRLGEKYPSGLYQIENMWQYTNRGLGMTHFPVRFNCRPEVTVFTLLSV